MIEVIYIYTTKFERSYEKKSKGENVSQKSSLIKIAKKKQR